MQSLWKVLGHDGALGMEVVQRLDGWASEVLQCRADALGLSEDGAAGTRALDYFFGVVKARDRLEAQVGSSDLNLVAAIDALFISITEEVDSDWPLLNGLESQAGRGWWWSRMPLGGPARNEFDLLVGGGH